MASDTEVVAKAQRRRFTAAEKLRVLREADRCAKPGELGALLPREGQYLGLAASAPARPDAARSWPEAKAGRSAFRPAGVSRRLAERAWCSWARW
jgi:hypothetical protein